VRAVVIKEFGGPEHLELADVPEPVAEAGQAVVKLEYAGINFIDIYMRSGRYARSATYKTPLPMTLGMEGGGVVAALGPGASGTSGSGGSGSATAGAGGRDAAGLRVGDRVAYCIVAGSYVEYAVVPAWRLVKIPDGLPMPVATALMLQGLTAQYLTHSAFRLEPGHSCLVHAGAGGVGQLLIQQAKQCGALVIATTGSAEKAAIARACGADHVILYRETDFREQVMQVTGGAGVNVVYDSVGRDTIDRSIRSLKKRGVCINYGGASGLVESINPLELGEAGSIFFTRPHLADYLQTREEIAARAADLFAAHAAGRLRVAIEREYPLADAAEAHRHIEGGRTKGKLLLRIC